MIDAGRDPAEESCLPLRPLTSGPGVHFDDGEAGSDDLGRTKQVEKGHQYPRSNLMSIDLQC